MFQDYCPECGHLLSYKRPLCSFCGWSQDNEKFDDKMGKILDLEYETQWFESNSYDYPNIENI